MTLTCVRVVKDHFKNVMPLLFWSGLELFKWLSHVRVSLRIISKMFVPKFLHWCHFYFIWSLPQIDLPLILLFSPFLLIAKLINVRLDKLFIKRKLVVIYPFQGLLIKECSWLSRLDFGLRSSFIRRHFKQICFARRQIYKRSRYAINCNKNSVMEQIAPAMSQNLGKVTLRWSIETD